jgi:hypothetical protein
MVRFVNLRTMSKDENYVQSIKIVVIRCFLIEDFSIIVEEVRSDASYSTVKVREFLSSTFFCPLRRYTTVIRGRI